MNEIISDLKRHYKPEKLSLYEEAKLLNELKEFLPRKDICKQVGISQTYLTMILTVYEKADTLMWEFIQNKGMKVSKAYDYVRFKRSAPK